MKNAHQGPGGYPALSPHLTVSNAAEAIRFYERAFGAKELSRMPWGDKIGHAQLELCGSKLMLNDEFPEQGSLAPPERGGGVVLHLYVPDVDAVFQRAVDAGATVLMPLENVFWGDRYGVVVDPFGHRWSLATQLEALDPQEIQARGAAAMGG